MLRVKHKFPIVLLGLLERASFLGSRLQFIFKSQSEHCVILKCFLLGILLLKPLYVCKYRVFRIFP